MSLKVDVRDKNASAAMHKFIGSVTVAFDEWPEGEEFDDWFPLQDESGAPTKSMIRIWGCYVQKISYIDPAERGLTQGAIGDVQVVCIAGLCCFFLGLFIGLFSGLLCSCIRYLFLLY